MLNTKSPPPQEVIMEESFIMMPSLPEDIVVDILSLLPVKSIFRFRCVCKNWCNNLLSDPKFVDMHLDHAIANNQFTSLLTGHNVPMYSVSWCSLSQSVIEIDSPFSPDHAYYCIYGSCNGLVLMFGIQGFILWNPSTKEIKEIPLAEDRISTNVEQRSFDELDDDTTETVSTVYGFGYSPILDDYKIIRAEMSYKASPDSVRNGCQVEVYSLRSNSWKRIPRVFPYDLFLGGKAIKPVSYNGAPHWIGSSCASLGEGLESSKAASVVVISFDVENDTFKEVPLTPELQQSLCHVHRAIDPYVSYQPMFNPLTLILQELPYYDQRYVDPCISYRSILNNCVFLGISGGCLSIVQGGELDSARNNNSGISIWVMKEYGVKESWTKMFSLSTQSIERSLKYSTMTVMDFTNGMVLFLKDKSSLVIYDPKHETTRVVNNGGLSLERWSHVDTYVESLVSLNSGIYLDQSVLASRPNYLARR